MKLSTMWMGTRALAAASAVAACGGPAGEPATAVTPETQTASEALGEPVECNPDGLKQGGNPLIIDWKSTDRADLEVLMGDGVAVVSFNCKEGVKLLTECSVKGDYGYRGVSVKSTTLSLKSADEVSANLTGGALVPVSIDAELKRGNSLNLAYFLVGKQSAARPFVAREELSGSCDGATHFVRRADIGAFAMTTAASGEVAGALELFGQAAKAGSSASKKVATVDGDPESCNGADPDADSPPKTCRAVIRLTLLPIDEAPLSEVAEKKGEAPGKHVALADGRGCPEGYVLADSKCQKKTAELTTYLCAKDDEAECKAMCEKGELMSCGRYANLLLANGDDRVEEARPLTDKLAEACNQHEESIACGLAGWLMRKTDESESVKLQVKGCKAGYVHSCQELHDILVTGTGKGSKDPARYVSLVEAACNAGSSTACFMAASEYLEGDIVDDTAKGRKLAQRSCDGASFIGCMVLAASLLPAKACKVMAGDAPDMQSWCSKPDESADTKAAIAAAKRSCALTQRACKPLEDLKTKCKEAGVCEALK